MSFLSSMRKLTTGRLDNPISTISVGLSMTSIVFLILTSQVGLYFWRTPIHSRDPLWIKSIVISIWMIQVSQAALAYYMSVLAHSSDSTLAEKLLRKIFWVWAMYVGTCVATEFLVHAFFISRIYFLESKLAHTRISVILCIILILETSFGFISMSLCVIQPSSENTLHNAVAWTMPVWLGLSLLVDILVAVSICYILKKNSPFTSIRLNLLVGRLTKFCIQTGLITSLVTGIAMALWIAAQLDFGHFCMSLPMGGIYATCFMANLIARESYFHHIQIVEDDLDQEFSMATGSIIIATPESIEK